MGIMSANSSIGEHVERLKNLSFEVGMYRPPSEGGSASLLLRTTENCPWNKCTFCEMYKGLPFVYRSVDDIKTDIDQVAAIRGRNRGHLLETRPWRPDHFRYRDGHSRHKSATFGTIIVSSWSSIGSTSEERQPSSRMPTASSCGLPNS